MRFICQILALSLVIHDCAPAVIAQESVARQWNEQLLSAIRLSIPNPPVHARNLFHCAVVMYDSWAAFDEHAVGYLNSEKAPWSSGDTNAARAEAISYAAYRLIRSRFLNGKNASTILSNLDEQMIALGYSPEIARAGVTSILSPADLGKRIAQDIIDASSSDGFVEIDYPQAYSNITNPNLNYPLSVLGKNGNLISNMPVGYGIPPATNPNFWQPLDLSSSVTQNGIIISGGVQTFLGVQSLATASFSLTRIDRSKPWIDPFGGPSKLSIDGANSTSDHRYKENALDVLLLGAALGDDKLINIAPSFLGNNALGFDDGSGYDYNPVTGLKYENNYAKLSDYTRVIAEYWADGPNSETPPGHWHAIANQVSDSPALVKRVGGTGPFIDRLEWDVKLYFALAAAMHDASCAAWSLKRYYSGARPITMIRYMGSKGQSSDPSATSYHPQGLLLSDGVVEVVTLESAAASGKHHLVWDLNISAYRPGSDFIGRVVVYSWPGEHPDNPAAPSVANHQNKLRWMLAKDWLPFQRKTFVTPAFPGYVSGHSTFSRAAAQCLSLFTGNPYFPGGLHQVTIPANSLQIDQGPSAAVSLQWCSYYDAADQAGISRRYGGIHPSEDDYHGRYIGNMVGNMAYTLAEKYWTGAITSEVKGVKILRQPSSVDVSESSRLVLSLGVEGTGPLSFQWRRYGQRISSATMPDFIIESTQLADQGVYDAVVSNVLGATTSEAANVIVHRLPWIKTQPRSQLLSVGQPAEITADFFGAVPLTCQWLKAGYYVSEGKSNKLSFPAVSLSNAGAYQLAVKNRVSSTTSAKAELSVVDTQAGEFKLGTGSSAKLSVQVAGNGLSFQWWKGNVIIKNNTRISGSNDKLLTIRQLTLSDSGAYHCVVTGLGGTIASGAQTLIVFDRAPKIPSGILMPDAMIGRDYAFQIPIDKDGGVATSYGASGLPLGLKLDTTSGVISGRPLAGPSGGYVVTLKATNSKGASVGYTIIVITPLRAGTIGSYTAMVKRDARQNGNLGDFGGRLDIVISGSAAYSGKLTLGSVAYSINGALNVSPVDDPTGLALIKTKDNQVLSLNFKLNLTSQTSQTLTGYLRYGGLDGDGEVLGSRNFWNTSPIPATNRLGMHTYALKTSSQNVLTSELPEGSGFGSAIVAKSGIVTLVIKLPDGGSVTNSSGMGFSGDFVAYSQLYTGTGSIVGQLVIAQDFKHSMTGDLDWYKQPQIKPSERLYKLGFGPVTVATEGGLYLPPTISQIIVGLPIAEKNAELKFIKRGPNALVNLTGLPNPIVFKIDSNNKPILPKYPSVENPNQVTFLVNPLTGTFSGRFLYSPKTTEGSKNLTSVVVYEGVLVSSLKKGLGYFLLPELPIGLTSPIWSGLVVFGPPDI